MNKLYINRFASGGGNPEDQPFEVDIHYTENYENGRCVSVTVLASGSVTLGSVYNETTGEYVSTEWSTMFPTNPVEKTYIENITETLTFSSRWNQTYTTTITIDQIDDSPTPTPSGPTYTLINNLRYGYGAEEFPLKDIVLDGKHIAEVWYNGEKVWGWDDSEQPTPPAQEIHFSIDEVEYTATLGMTWAEWLNSDYGSSAGYELIDNEVMNFRGNNVYYAYQGSHFFAYGTDAIIAEKLYWCNM